MKSNKLIAFFYRKFSVMYDKCEQYLLRHIFRFTIHYGYLLESLSLLLFI